LETDEYNRESDGTRSAFFGYKTGDLGHGLHSGLYISDLYQ